MICPDTVCQEIKTCKWDCEIAAVWCPSMYAEPTKEHKPVDLHMYDTDYKEVVPVPPAKPEFKPRPQPEPKRQQQRQEFLGRDYRGINRPRN